MLVVEGSVDVVLLDSLVVGSVGYGVGIDAIEGDVVVGGGTEFPQAVNAPSADVNKSSVRLRRTFVMATGIASCGTFVAPA
jgi:hypothetical protein